MSFEENETTLRSLRGETEHDRNEIANIIYGTKRLVARSGKAVFPPSFLSLLNEKALLILGEDMRSFFERHPTTKNRAYTLVSESTTSVNDLIYVAVVQPSLVSSLGLSNELLDLLRQDNETRSTIIGILKVRDLNSGMNAFCSAFRLNDEVSSLPWKILDEKLTNLNLNDEEKQTVVREIWGKGSHFRKEMVNANFPGLLIDELEAMGMVKYSELSMNEIKALKSRFQLTTFQQSILDRTILKSVPFFGSNGKWNSQKSKCQKFVDDLIKAKNSLSEMTNNEGSTNNLQKLLVSLGFRNDDEVGVIRDALNEALDLFNPLPESPFTSDEEMVANVDDGAALYGLCFGMIRKNVKEASFCKKAQKALFKPANLCKVTEMKQQGPLKKTFHFIDVKDANNFKKFVFDFGLTFAENLTHKFPSFVRDESVGSSKSMTVLAFFVCPTLSFQLAGEHLNLTDEASDRLEVLRDPTDASDFLEAFGSHIICGTQQLGGIVCNSIKISLPVDKPTIQIAKFANDLMERSLSELKFRPSKSVTEEQSFLGDLSCQVHCIYEAENRGPALAKFELFFETIKYSPSNWHIIERNIPGSILPIWEWIATQIPNKKCQTDLLCRAWLQKVAPMETEDLVAKEIERTVSSFQLQQIEDRQKRIELLLDQFCSYTNVSNHMDDDTVLKELQEFYQLWWSSKSFSDNEKARQFSSFLAFVAEETVKCNAALLKTIKFLKFAIDEEFIVALQNANCPLDDIVRDLLKPSQEDEADKRSLNERLDNAQFENLDILLNKELKESDERSEEVLHWRIVMLVNAALQAKDDSFLLKNSLHNLLSTKFKWINGGFQFQLTKLAIRQLYEDINELMINNEYGGRQEREIESTEDSLNNYGSQVEFDLSDTASPSQMSNTELSGTATNKTCYIQDPVILHRSKPLKRNKQKSFIEFLTDYPIRSERSASLNGNSQLEEQKKELTRCLRGRLTLDILQENDLENLAIYDVLLELIADYGAAGVSEIYQLLLERRCMVPIFNPLTCEHYLALLREVPYVIVPGDLPIKLCNTDLYRITVISYCPLKESQAAELINDLFRIKSFHVQKKISQPLTKEELVIDVGVGYISGTQLKDKGRNTETSRTSNENHVLVTQVVGKIDAAATFIRDFADLLIVEEEDEYFHTRIKRKEASNLIGDNTQVVIWSPSNKIFERSSVRENKEKYGLGFIGVKSPLREVLINELSSILRDEISRVANNQHHRKSWSELTPLEKYSTQPIETVFECSFDVDAMLDTNVKSVVETRKKFLLQLSFRDQYVYEEQKIEHRMEQNKVEDANRGILECQEKRKLEAINVENIPLIKTFIDILQNKNSRVRVGALRQLEFGLSTRTEAELKALQKRINEQYELLVGNVTNSTKESDDDSESKKQEYAQAKQAYREAMLHIEHIWRELSHLYVSDPNKYRHLPELAAQHLFDGFSIELLDGDANMMNLPWITAVLVGLNNLINNKNKNRMLVLSVMGVQSSGKSTLLNTMFGIKMRTSVGQCTRGINMQLIPVEGRKEYDYVLVLDTEGTRSPDFYGMPGNEKRDNQMATLSILLADATIVVNPGENDAAVKEILPIVLLAYQGSKLAQDHGGRLSSMMFFVYNRIDTTQREKLTNIVQSLANSLTEAFKTVGKMSGYKTGSNSNQVQPNRLFRNFKLDASNSADSDVRILGQNKISFNPPDNVPDPDYGASLVEFREHIHRRVTETGDGVQWSSRSPSDLSEYIHLVWKCVCSSNFNLQFAHVVERINFDRLEADYQRVKHELASEYQEQFAKLRKRMIAMNEEIEKSERSNREFREKIKFEISELIVQLDGRVNEITKMPGREKWRIVYEQNWETWKSQQNVYWSQQLKSSFDAIVLYDQALEELKKSMRETISNMNKNRDPNLHHSEKQLEEEFNKVMGEYLKKAKADYPSINVEDKIAAVYRSSVIIKLHGINVFDQALETSCEKYFLENVLMSGQETLQKQELSTRLFDLLKNAAKKVTERIIKTKPTVIEEMIKELSLCTKMIEIQVKTSLTGVACYDDSIVQGMIEKTDQILGKVVNKIEFSHREIVHTYTRKVLEHFLPDIQLNWERHNSVPNKFGSPENRKEMREFFFMAAREANQMKLFGFLIKQKFLDLEKAFQAEMIAQTVKDIKQFEWIYNFKNIQNFMDELLVELLDKNDISKLIKYIKRPDEHLKEVLLRLICHIAKDKLEGEKGWINFLDILKSKVRIATDDALNTKENRVSVFLQTLRQSLLGSLESDVISQGIVIHLGAGCNELDSEDFKEEFKVFEEELIETITKQPSPTRKKEFARNIAESVIKNLRDQNAAGAMPRCEALCPWCKSMCILHAGHNSEVEKHDTKHQPSGLNGFIYHKTHNLVPDMCSSYTDEDSFIITHSDGREDRFLFRQWYEYHPQWTKPHHVEEWPLREYIFYHYHEDFAKYYGCRPCNDMNPTYNRDLRVIRQKLKENRIGSIVLYDRL